MFHEQALTEEQQMLRRVLAQVGKDHDNAYFLKKVRAGKFPHEFWDVMAQNGILTPEASEVHGGSAFGLADLTVLLYDLGVEALASYHLMGHYLAGHALSAFGSADQQAAHLPSMGKGKRWGVAVTEDTVGRNAFACATRAVADGNDFVLRGRKVYTPCGGEVDHLLVTARLSGDGTGHGASGIGVFIVDRTAPGVKAQEREINIRVSEQREARSATGDSFYNLDFEDVRVARSALIGSEDGAVAKAMVTRTLLMLAAMTVGWGDRVIKKAVDYANQRVLYTEPISAYQAIQHPMVRAKTDVEMAKLLIERAVDAHSEVTDTDDLLMYAAVAKYAATEGALNAFDIAIQAHGGSGFDREVGVITLWPLALLSRTMPLNSDVILDRFGERLLQPQVTGAPAARALV